MYSGLIQSLSARNSIGLFTGGSIKGSQIAKNRVNRLYKNWKEMNIPSILSVGSSEESVVEREEYEDTVGRRSDERIDSFSIFKT